MLNKGYWIGLLYKDVDATRTKNKLEYHLLHLEKMYEEEGNPLS